MNPQGAGAVSARKTASDLMAVGENPTRRAGAGRWLTSAKLAASAVLFQGDGAF